MSTFWLKSRNFSCDQGGKCLRIISICAMKTESKNWAVIGIDRIEPSLGFQFEFGTIFLKLPKFIFSCPWNRFIDRKNNSWPNWDKFWVIFSCSNQVLTDHVIPYKVRKKVISKTCWWFGQKNVRIQEDLSYFTAENIILWIFFYILWNLFGAIDVALLVTR